MEEKIKRAFESELGQQCDCLFSTSDERIFIRYNESVQHSQGMLDPNTKPLSDETILIWFEEYTGQDPNPT